MKPIEVIVKKPDMEEKVIFEILEKTEKISRAIDILQEPDEMQVYDDENRLYKVSLSDILYIDSIDAVTFVYSDEMIYTSKKKLYELEEELPEQLFLRVGKGVIVNIKKIKNVSPFGGGRFEAILQNDEKVVISRKYVPNLKARLGL